MQTTVAATITKQIGPGSLMRIGAHTPLGIDNGVIWHMGRGHRNKLMIVLDADDTYTVSIGKLRGVEYTQREIATGIYCDQLSQIVAGLD